MWQGFILKGRILQSLEWLSDLHDKSTEGLTLSTLNLRLPVDLANGGIDTEAGADSLTPSSIYT